MGTNFYLKTDICDKCGRGHEKKHIGKSSAGWCFALHVIPEESINELSDWERLWNLPTSQIFDEYGTTLSPEEMRSRILDREWKGKEPMRSHVDDRHCTGPGKGTYDLCPGEFS